MGRPLRAVGNHALLLFLYNAGARADEAAQVLVEDLALPQVLDRDLASVLIRGKGSKSPPVSAVAQTVRELTALVQGHGPSENVFLNRCGRPITRFGIHTLWSALWRGQPSRCLR